MSTLKVTEIQSLSASTPPLFEDSSGAEMGRLCRAFVNFNGTGTVSTNQTIRASFNVSSVFKNGTGDYTVNFTNAFIDTNYVCVTMLEPSLVPSVGATFYTIIGTNSSNPFTRTTSSSQIKTAYITSLSGASTPWDSQGTNVAFFR